MMAFLTALHDSAFSTWIRESETVWAFPTVLTVHTFGMMLLVGCAWVASASSTMRYGCSPTQGAVVVVRSSQLRRPATLLPIPRL